MQLIIELPPRDELIAFNRKRWSEVLADRTWADLPFKIETNAHGTVLMTPPRSGRHSNRQGEVTYQLRSRLGGHALPECPISTLDGVKAADVGWYSQQRFSAVEGQEAFEMAPQICVEILSPSNTDSEMKLKRQLYFEAGAEEVWICDLEGAMNFYFADEQDSTQSRSRRCPEFPPQL